MIVERMILSTGQVTLVIEDEEAIEEIEPLISSAARENGIVNMASPEHTFEIVYSSEDIQRYFLWIGEKGQKSTLMRSDDISTIYTVSEELTDRLIELMENAE